MSVEHYDLAQRLKAAALRRPIPRSTYAPCLTPLHPVAVTFDGPHNARRLKACTTTRAHSATGPNALTALQALGVELTCMRTLVIPDRQTLQELRALAVKAADSPALADVATIIGWWDQRADHPGTTAVLNVSQALRARWALGTTPKDERSVGTWVSWFELDEPNDSPEALLALADKATQGQALPGLLDALAADNRSWEYHQQRHTKGQDWRTPDTRAEAALGLATRCHANELYESLRLTDPLVAYRETFTGTVVVGTVSDIEGKTVTVLSDRLICRLRRGMDIQGQAGALATPTPEGITDLPNRLTGQLSAATIVNSQLHLTITGALARRGPLTIGDTIALRPRATDSRQQANGRRNIRSRYRYAGNWLAGGAAPTPKRRSVPLDVVIAAAED